MSAALPVSPPVSGPFEGSGSDGTDPPTATEPPADADPPDEAAIDPAATSIAIADATPSTAATLGFLLSVLARRERRAEELSLRALTILGAPEATGVIRRCLHSADPETRAQAV